MAFTLHLNPHHVWHPRLGWLTPEMLAPYGGLKALVGERLGSAGGFGHTCLCPTPCPTDSNHPEVDHPHHVEVDGSTGLHGYTRLEDEEIAVRAWCELFRSIASDIRRQRLVAERDAQLAIIRQAAAADPAYAALARQVGIAL